MNRWRTLLIFVGLFFGLLLPCYPAQATHTHRVLLISSYHPAFPTFFQQIEGIQAGFADQNIELDVEFMDSKHADLLNEIKEKNDISDELEDKLKKALDEFKTVFQAPA